MRQIAALLAEYGVNTKEALMDAAENGSYDYDFLDEDKTGIAKLEGYLFPDTYEFFVGENAEHALKRLLDNFNVKMDADLMEQVIRGQIVCQAVSESKSVQRDSWIEVMDIVRRTV